MNLLQKSQNAISKINQLSENKFNDISNLLDASLIDFDEVVHQIELASSEINHNEQEAENIEERIFLLRGLARKHRCDVDDLHLVLENFKNKLASISISGENIDALNKQLVSAKNEYIKKGTINEQEKRCNVDLASLENLINGIAK